MMPRAKCTQVTEHRVTLGSYERERLDQYLADQKLNNQLSAIGDVVQPFGQALGYGALALGVAYGLNTFQDRGINGWFVRFTQDRSTLPDGNEDFISNNFITNGIKEIFGSISDLLS